MCMSEANVAEVEKNIFRKAYRQLNEAEKQRLDEIKDKAQELYDLFDTPIFTEISSRSGDGRSLTLAKDNLEQAVMWGVKGFTG